MARRTPMNDIFLSYAHGDLERVKAIVAACEARGWSVFWDRTIPPGKTWREIIGKALDEFRCVVVVWSSTSIKSRWVQEEADEGRERGILVPLLLDDVKPPMGFRDLQAARLANGHLTPAALRPVLASIAALLDASAPTASDATRPLLDVSFEGSTKASRDRAALGPAVVVPVLVVVTGWALGGALGLGVTFSIAGIFGRSFGGGVGWAIGGILGATPSVWAFGWSIHSCAASKS